MHTSNTIGHKFGQTIVSTIARIDVSEIEQQDTLLGILANLKAWQFAAHTCIESGGVTCNRHGERYLLQSGYSVGLVQGTAIILPHDVRYLDIIKGWKRILESFPQASHVGGWIDQDGIHLDPVCIFSEFQPAFELACDNMQRAIWDFSANGGKGGEISLSPVALPLSREERENAYYDGSLPNFG